MKQTRFSIQASRSSTREPLSSTKAALSARSERVWFLTKRPWPEQQPLSGARSAHSGAPHNAKGLPITLSFTSQRVPDQIMVTDWYGPSQVRMPPAHTTVTPYVCPIHRSSPRRARGLDVRHRATRELHENHRIRVDVRLAARLVGVLWVANGAADSPAGPASESDPVAQSAHANRAAPGMRRRPRACFIHSSSVRRNCIGRALGGRSSTWRHANAEASPRKL
jgi:hypothetical protein